MQKILVGADPELFVKDAKGRFRSAHNMIAGTKADPFPVACGAYQVDGMAVEFNIHPAATPEEFQNNIERVMQQMEEALPKGHTMHCVPTATFHGNHIRVQPEEATQLGCEPDYNAYTMKENPKPNGKVNFRTASGHVHIGFCDDADVMSEDHMLKCAMLVRHLDVFLGLPSLLWDNDKKRRELYGKAGAFRPKKYGVEYRSLSNAWLRDPALIQYVFNQVQKAVEDLKSGRRFKDSDLKVVQSKVNGDPYFGYGYHFNPQQLCKKYGIELPPVMAEENKAHRQAAKAARFARAYGA